MTTLFLSILSAIFVATPALAATDLHYKTFGDPAKPALLFLHGGPGSNSFYFEASVAEKAAELGLFVVAFDQRGSARSPKGEPEAYTFARAVADIDELIDTLHLVRPLLLGHSWGGTPALLYLDAHPEKARGAFLVGSPINYPRVYDFALARCEEYYSGRHDERALADVRTLKAKMYPRGLEPPFAFEGADIAAAMTFANNCGLMLPLHPSPGAIQIWLRMVNSPDGHLLNEIAPEPGSYFHRNEGLGNFSIMPLLQRNAARVFALYGEEDRLFSPGHLAEIRGALPEGRFRTLPASSHYPFIDQQPAFLTELARVLEQMAP